MPAHSKAAGGVVLRKRSLALTVLVTCAVFSGCASHSQEASAVQPKAVVTAAVVTTPPPPPAPVVAGEWSWTASLGANVMDGTMHIDAPAAPGSFSGSLQSQGMALPVKNFIVSGRGYVFLVEAPDGIYTVKGTFLTDGTMEGTVDGPPGPGSFKAKRN